jgi:hypothetical protein
MIIIDNTASQLECKLGEAIAGAELSILVSYVDIVSSPYGYATKTTTTNGTTAVNISGNLLKEFAQRRIKYISIDNIDSIPHEVTVQINDGTNVYKIFTFIIASGSTIYYEDNAGWYVLDSYGAPVTTPATTVDSYVSATGTDNYIGSLPGLLAYTEGLSLSVKFENANTANTTLNINGLGAIDLKIFGTDDTGVNPDGVPDIKAGQILDLTYDGVNFQIKSVTDRIVMSL